MTHPNGTPFYSSGRKLEGEEKKSLQDILLSTAKVIILRVKSQARGQNNRSITLK